MASTQPPTQSQILTSVGQISQKISCKTESVFYLISLIFLQLLYKIVWRNRFLFLAQSRPFDFTFSEDFSVWKVPFALQVDI